MPGVKPQVPALVISSPVASSAAHLPAVPAPKGRAPTQPVLSTEDSRTPNMSAFTHLEMIEKNKNLLMGYNAVESRIANFPPQLMTANRLQNYQEELQEIKDKLNEFSGDVAAYSLECLSISQPLPQNHLAQELNFK